LEVVVRIRFIAFAYVVALCARCLGSDVHDAVSAGDPARVVEALNRNSELINEPDASGKMPLHIAVEKKDAKIASLLLSKGAKPSARDHSGRTPLYLAVKADSLDCVRVIVTETSAGYTDPMLDVRQAEGREALQDGTLALANDMLGRLVRLDPENQAVNFAYGISWLSIGDSSPAGPAFERILSVNPRNDRARAELARTRIAQQRYAEAKRELQKVLISDLPSDVRKSIESCLSEVKNRMTRWFYSGNVEIGALYDSNVNVGPDSQVIQISPVIVGNTRITELQLKDPSKPRDTTGLSAGAGLRAMYDIGGPGDWLGTADAAAYRNWLEEGSFETVSAQAGIGIKLMMERGFFQLPYRARYIEYGGEPLAWIHGIYPSFAYVPQNLNGVSLFTTASAELWEFDTYTLRDGYYLSIGETARQSFEGGRYNIYGGAELQYNKADSDVYTYSCAGALAGADCRLPWKLNAMAEVRYFYRDYSEKEALAPRVRRDNQYIISAGLAREMSERFTVSLVYNAVINDSTFDLYEYRRNIVTLSTNYKF